MVNDGGCPFMFDGPLSFDRVLMPASQASTALRHPPSTTSWSPSPRERGEASFWKTRSPPPCKRGEARFWVNRPSPPCFSRPPHLGGWVASGARRKGASMFFLPTPILGVGGERSETEGGISAMVNDGGCPFMFDGTLSFDRVLMPASQASTAWSGPLPPLRGPPPPASRGRQDLR
ncbi:MAG: hypothetical protein ACFWUL_00030 [Dialister sp.]|jgi:hypothetical protein